MSDSAFAVYSYRTENIGDDLQSLAAENLLPGPPCQVDRDSGAVRCRRGEQHDHHYLVANAWYSNQPENWPLPASLTPLFVSMHLSVNDDNGLRVAAADWFLRDGLIDYLRDHGPIGTRDLATLERLKSVDVPAYFTGCMTLTFPQYDGPRHDRVVLADVPPETVPRLLPHLTGEVLAVTHRVPAHLAETQRRARAEDLLESFRTARLVITTRLHSALPALAFGTPCLLLDHGQVDGRFSGYRELVEVADIRRPDASLAEPLRRVETAPLRRDHVTLAEALRSAVGRWVDDVRRGELPDAVPDRSWQAAATATAIAEARHRARQTKELRQRLETADAELAGMRGRLEAATGELADLQDRLEAARVTAKAEQEALREKYEIEAADAARSQAELERLCDHLRADLHAMQVSRSWRMTAPLRLLRGRNS
jgi:hypothetical protein